MKVKQTILALCAIDTQKGGKVMISPIGEVTGRDGRRFIVGGEAQLQKLLESGLKLPLMVDHGGGRHGDESVAWFDQFELMNDGIYAFLTPTQVGTELIESNKYKYLSPEYLVNYDTNEVDLIVGVGLVNKPNLLSEALNHQESEMATSSTDNAAEAQAENQQLKTQLESVKTKNVELQAQVDANNAELQAQNKALLKQLSINKVDTAIGAGKLAPAKKDFALALEANALDGFLELEAQTFKVTESNQLNPDKPDDLDNNCEIMQQLGLVGDE